MYDKQTLKSIAEKFYIQDSITNIKDNAAGFINDTFFLNGEKRNYILQRKNSYVFSDIKGMMNNILGVTEHIKSKLVSQGKDPEKGTITLFKTKDELPYYIDDNSEYWSLFLFIDDTITHNEVSNLKIAYNAGVATGEWQYWLSDYTKPLAEVLPGFHDMAFRFEQWDECISNNFANRIESVKDLVFEIESRKNDILNIKRNFDDNSIPKRVSHNDTKISNFLFDNQDNVVALIDLDTVMRLSVLFDYGDAIRSYVNTAAEDEPNTDAVNVDFDIFKSYTEGYLKYGKLFLNNTEIENLLNSAIYIVYEQTLRFLVDYIDGDKYYKISYPEHNLVRTKAQLKLLKTLELNRNRLLDIVYKASIC